MSGNKVILSADVIRNAAKELGMVEPAEEGSILAAIDDYFLTLANGQYSPMSGEHNNASNYNEVYIVAKKHNVDPNLMMKYLTHTSIFDKFQKLSVNESMLPDYIGTRIKSKLKPEAYKKFKGDAVNAVVKALMKGANLGTIVDSISGTYSIPRKELLSAVRDVTSADGSYGVTEEDDVKKKKGIEGKKGGSNPVQKNLREFNKGGRHTDKKNDYRRKEKHSKSSATTEGYRVVPSIDKDRYQNREWEGLEGPYSNKHGRVYYYDTKAGKYYDPDTDIYMAVDDVMESKVGSALQESVNRFISVLEGKQMSIYQAKLINLLDNMNADYLFTGDKVLLEEPLGSQILEKFPEMAGLIITRGKKVTETIAGNIAGSAQPIGDMQKRRGIAEIEYEKMEDGEVELDEYDGSDDRGSDQEANLKFLKQSMRQGGEITVYGADYRARVFKYDFDNDIWTDTTKGKTYSTEELSGVLKRNNGESFVESKK